MSRLAVGRLLMEARAQNGWSLTEAANVQQINKSTLSRIENHPGYSLNMSLLKLIQMFNIYQLSFIDSVVHIDIDVPIITGGTVILVDDSAVQLLIYEMLISTHFEEVSVLAFKNPREANEWLKANRARLIITDYHMPDIDGVELLYRQTKNEINRFTPSILMTDKVEFELIRKEQKTKTGFSFSNTVFYHKHRPKPDFVSLVRDLLVLT